MAVARRPDFFKAASAGAPVVRWEDYDTHYTERYIGLPSENPEAYRVSDVTTYAKDLKQPLLIIHGMRDDTVLFKDTLALVQRLILADRPVELAVLPDAPHGWDTKGLAQSRYAFSRLVEFFERHLKPTASP